MELAGLNPALAKRKSTRDDLQSKRFLLKWDR